MRARGGLQFLHEPGLEAGVRRGRLWYSRRNTSAASGEMLYGASFHDSQDDVDLLRHVVSVSQHLVELRESDLFTVERILVARIQVKAGPLDLEVDPPVNCQRSIGGPVRGPHVVRAFAQET